MSETFVWYEFCGKIKEIESVVQRSGRRPENKSLIERTFTVL